MDKRKRNKEIIYGSLVVLALGIILVPLWWGKKTEAQWEGALIAAAKEPSFDDIKEEEECDADKQSDENPSIRMKEPPPTIETPVEPKQPKFIKEDNT